MAHRVGEVFGEKAEGRRQSTRSWIGEVFAIALAVVACLLVSCVAPGPDDLSVGMSEQAIVDGSFDRGRHPAVIFLWNARRGAACSGTIIAPRLVLTAKHCVRGRGDFAEPPDAFRVYVGNSVDSFTDEYRVQEVRVAPGCWGLCGDESDVAVLILTTAATQAPLTITFESPRSLIGEQITAVGFGQIPSGSSGTKYTVEKRVMQVRGDTIVVQPTVCEGDSGGPVIAADGNIYGVASFIFSEDGSPPVCGTAPGVYNGISLMEDFLVTAIEDSGSCLPDGAEVCDGRDNNCDGALDEGCIAIGGACTDNDECVGGLCGDTPAGRACTEACNPLSPDIGCPLGTYCARTGGCDGVCAPRMPPTTGTPLGNGIACTADTDCGSLHCVDPGDGTRRCLTPCQGDAAMCLAGEACAAPSGACGACVLAGIVGGTRGIGEPCSVDDECRSGSCYDDEGTGYCSDACASDADCLGTFHCRGDICARGPRGSIGGGCVSNADCSTGLLCALTPAASWCTSRCETEACPEGFDCVDAGGALVCAPTRSLLGQSCMINEDCISNLCIDGGYGPVCTEVCGPTRACTTGFECIRASDGVNGVCLGPAPPPPADEGGCAIALRSRTAPAAFLGLLPVALALVWSRRRRGR